MGQTDGRFHCHCCLGLPQSLKTTATSIIMSTSSTPSSPSRRRNKKKGSSSNKSSSADYHSEIAVLAAVGLSSDDHADLKQHPDAFGNDATQPHKNNKNSAVWDDDSSSSSSSDDNDFALLSSRKSRHPVARHGEVSLVDDRGMSMLLDPVQQVTALNYVAEHRIFLKAILELLSQRDSYCGIEVDINDPNTIKCGPLKKASHNRIRGAWKVFYVEVRRGLLSYYEDVASKDALNDTRLQRKNVALQANLTTIRPVKIQNLTGGAVFELSVQGRPKKLWMASSSQERQAWMASIQSAMVGGSVVRGEATATQQDVNSSSNSGTTTTGSGKKKTPPNPHKAHLQTYLRVQGAIMRATSKEAYVNALSLIIGESINIPVQWIRERTEKATTPELTEANFLEEDTAVGVRQIWKDLLRDSVSINGELFRGNCGHGPERIVGALTRTIMSKSSSSNVNNDPCNSRNDDEYPHKSSVTESQALSYARDVLLAGNRTRSGGDSYFCVDTLTKHSGLCVLCPSTTQAEPLQITVETLKSNTDNVQELSGWIKSKSGGSSQTKPFKKRYFCLTEGTLSFYEQARPRPHGLRGQLVLAHASLYISQQETALSKDDNIKKTRIIVHVVMRDGTKGRQLCFDDLHKFMLWTSALEDAIRRNAGKSSSLTKSVVSKVRRGLRDELDGNNNKDSASTTTAANTPAAEFTCLKDYAVSQGLDEEALEERIALLRQKSGKSKSSVNISVRASTEYKICTTDPQGDDGDTWAWIRASFLQDFCVSGGPNGRIKRGEEIVQICIQDHA